MASPTRNPKDLRSIIDHQPEGDPASDKLSKLTKFVSNDHSENALLRSRIEEQGQLICYLKQRSDEYMNRNKNLSEINSELETLRNNTIDELKNSKKTCTMLEKRFFELADNHEEIIKIKDGYKSRSQQLLVQNKILKEENKQLFSAAIRERDDKITENLLKISKQEKLIDNLQLKNDKLKSEINETAIAHGFEIESLKVELKQNRIKITNYEEKINRLNETCNQFNKAESETIQTLRKENENFLKQVMQRGKLLQEKQSEIDFQILNLKKVEEEMIKLKAEFATKEYRVNSNLRVKLLTEENESLKEEIRINKLEFDAFKIHSNKLLTQEKELNSKLRRNIS